MLDWRQPKVLTWHTVLPQRPRQEALFFYAQPTDEEFDRQVAWLRRECRPLSAEEYLEVIEGRRPAPRRSVLVTFDDGFRGSLLAAEILSRHGVPGVLFLAVDFVDGHRWPWYLALDWLIEHSSRQSVEWRGETWPLTLLSERKVFRDRYKDLYLAVAESERQPLMRRLARALDAELPAEPPATHRFLEWPEVADLAAADTFAIGSHGLSHHDLTRLSDEELEAEMRDSRDRIEARAGVRPRLFSYPDGRHDHRVRGAARRHYRAGLALLDGADAGDPFRLPRLPALAGGEEAVRRVLAPTYRLRHSLWRWRARHGWI